MGAAEDADNVEPKARAFEGRPVSPKDIDSPHPRLSEAPSPTLSPQSIDQAQNRTARAMSPCYTSLTPPSTWPSLLPAPPLPPFLAWLWSSLLQLCLGTSALPTSGLPLLVRLSLSWLLGEVAF